jgi:hypothetical protein
VIACRLNEHRAMKVLDLQCAMGHAFEGWFGSEDDFVSQLARSLVQCPLCGDATVHKKLSAPRLNLSTTRQDRRAESDVVAQPAAQDKPLTAAWLEIARRIVTNSDDVGERFADEARKMHYGETPERAIRGKTTVDEARALLEEGIEVLPLVLPAALKETLQ